MGCASSKPPVCRNCRKPCSPINRSQSMHVHHPPQRQGDTYHVVALTSSTLGSLKLDPLNQSTNITKSTPTSTQLCTLIQNGDSNQNPNQIGKENKDFLLESVEANNQNPNQIGKENKDFLLELVEAKTWSKMIDEKIPKIPKITPKTPVRTPPGEPETINAWELMEGLEDCSPLPHYHNRSFSFNVAPNFNDYKSKIEETDKPMWLDMAESDSNSNSNSIVSGFDTDVIKTFRKTLEELPPANQFLLNTSNETKYIVNDEKPVKKVVHKKEKVIVYFTSLRGVRKTYEDCCNVRVILKGIGIKVDERDVSMHSGFREELKEVLKENGINFGSLPKVFIGKKYMGGIDEIRLLNEEGKLLTAFEDCERLNDGVSVCEGCGDVRFVPCETCSGSCKIYYQSEEDDDNDEDEERYGFERCPNCNENGLIRCPICCD